jgi:hypothetical protein
MVKMLVPIWGSLDIFCFVFKPDRFLKPVRFFRIGKLVGFQDLIWSSLDLFFGFVID